ncbi:MAG: Mfa1 family fimbria major subunit [Candidatus Cryptobacteroides sp.]|nr:Mfa1 family fimbria major subunit [Candidatus Cryptobacteroides sp.]
MKKINYLLAAALFIAAGCEKSPVDQGTTDAGNLYMQFSVKMLSTRSQTDNTGDSNSNADPDTEVGLAKENTISTVDIALVGGGSTVVASNVTPTAANGSTYVAKFDTRALVAGTTYKVYIYANCSAPSAVDVDAVSKATIAEMTADNKFWMTNASSALNVTLPGDLAPYTQPNTPLSLGAHTVERSMARFDYKASGPFDMGAGLSLTLTDAALINQSKAHYMFRRVTAGADATASGAVVGGVETPTNWVVDTDWSNKVAANFDAQLEAPSTWDWKSLAELTADKNANDNYAGDYKIWCYAKENTIPGVDAQKHNVSTGVVFKAEITAGDDASTTVKNAMAAGNRIYVFNNVLYGAWSDVKTAAEAGTDPTLQAAYNQAAATIAADKTEPAGADAAAAGFTGYSPKDGKYYVYYYYWNRHNDNLDPYTMGTMEFAVVRNNVYKLAVDKISRFGHPTPPDPSNPDPDPEPDPDPVDPDDPDESVNYYFNVTVKVLPWTVRINNIEF